MGTDRERFAWNVAAIQLLHLLKNEGRSATPEEQEVLSRYSGWGWCREGINPFNPQNAYKTPEYLADQPWRLNQLTPDERLAGEWYATLKPLMTEGEWTDAKSSVLNAHYTSPAVIRELWKAVQHLGFEGGRVLEPAAGVGNFFGMMPEALQNTSRKTAVEREPFAAAMVEQLYPSATVFNRQYEDAAIPENSQDLVISNVPFSPEKVSYQPFRKTGRQFLNQNLHNFYFARSLDAARPGGIIAFITSTHTMDNTGAQSRQFREYVAQHADFLGAVRLPAGAFKENAGTQVSTDVIFLKKHDPEDPEFESKHPRDAQGRFINKWGGVGEVPATFRGKADDYRAGMAVINQHYLEHPEQMLGQMDLDAAAGPYRGQGLIQSPGRDWEAELPQALAALPAGVYHPPFKQEAILDRPEPEPPDYVKDGAFYVQDGVLYQRHGRAAEEVSGSPARLAKISRMVAITGLTRNLIRTQLTEEGDENADRIRANLNQLYDEFVADFGPLHDKKNVRDFASDPDAAVLLALEKWNRKTGEATKADIFTHRTVSPTRKITHVDTPRDALNVSLNEFNRMNWDRMEEITDRDRDELQQELAGDGLIYRNPDQANDAITEGWEPAAAYLSGNVREKLRTAEAAAKIDPAYEVNVSALRDMQPARLEPQEISIKLGAGWIPPKIVEEFIDHLIGPGRGREPRQVYNRETDEYETRGPAPLVGYSEAGAIWAVGDVGWDRKRNIANTQTWGATWQTEGGGTRTFDAMECLEAILNLKQPKATKPNPADPDKRITDDEGTQLIRARMEKIKEEWKNWVWSDPERAHDLADYYNENFNNTVLRQFDGSYLTLPGMATEVASELRQTSKDAIARILQTGNTLLDITVGGGKTRMMVGAAMEQKRLGLAQKTMICVPKHILEQFRTEFLEAYPGAKVLMQTAKDFSEDRRSETMSRIATNDWDAILVTHQSFEKLPVSNDTWNDYIQGEIDDLEEAYQNAESDLSQKQIERMLRTQRARLRDRQADLSENKDRALMWEDLGIDSLMVDEAHLFKNLFFATKMSGVLGVPRTDTGRARDLAMKSQQMLAHTGQRGLVLSTGTPISNTVAEMYVMQRYLQLPYLKEQGLKSFDAWAQQYGDTITAIERRPNGTYDEKTRFRKFSNVPEMLKDYRRVAEVRRREDIPGLIVPELETGAPIKNVVDASPRQRAYMQYLADLSEEIKANPDQYPGGQLRVTTLGRLMSVDYRLVDPEAPDDPNSKINRCVRDVVETHAKHAANRATQLVFLDVGVPSKADKEQAESGAEVQEPSDEESGLGKEEEARLETSLYADLRKKLIAQGIPADEIAFIHDYPKDEKKMELFDKVNSGEIRVLIGSTGKMGTGMNVQKRLIAAHHIDAPWVPSDVEQRDGRLIRSGNMHAPHLDEETQELVGGTPVRSVRYITQGTFDEYIWQTLEYKARFIAQARSGDLNVREMEELAPVVADAATTRALASENPLIKEKADLDNEVAKLSTLLSVHIKQRDRNQYNIVENTRRAEGVAQDIKRHQAALAHYEKNKPGEFSMEVGDKTFAKREEAGQALQQEMSDYEFGKRTDPQTVGHYAGFDIYLAPYSAYGLKSEERPVFWVSTPDGATAWPLNYTPSNVGVTQTVTNQLSRLPETIKKLEGLRADHLKSAEDLRAEVRKPWEHENRMAELTRQQQEIDARLMQRSAQAEGTEEEIPPEVVTYPAPETTNFDDPQGDSAHSTLGKAFQLAPGRYVILVKATPPGGNGTGRGGQDEAVINPPLPPVSHYDQSVARRQHALLIRQQARSGHARQQHNEKKHGPLLEESHGRYFNLPDDAVTVPLHNLIATKTTSDKTAAHARALDGAAKGKKDKQPPVLASEAGDGSYRVHGTHAHKTLALAHAHGWRTLPVVPIDMGDLDRGGNPKPGTYAHQVHTASDPDHQPWFDSDTMNLPPIPRQEGSSVDEVYAGARVGHDQIGQILGGVARRLGLKQHGTGDKPDLKAGGGYLQGKEIPGLDQTWGEAEARGGDWGRLTNLSHHTIAVDRPSDVRRVLAHLKAAGLEHAGRPSETFSEGGPLGQRAATLHVRAPNGHVGRVTIELKGQQRAHKDAEPHRRQMEMLDALTQTQGRDMDEGEQRRYRNAAKKIRGIYDSAWRTSGGKLKKAMEAEIDRQPDYGGARGNCQAYALQDMPAYAEGDLADPRVRVWVYRNGKWDTGNQYRSMLLASGRRIPTSELQRLIEEGGPTKGEKEKAREETGPKRAVGAHSERRSEGRPAAGAR